MTTFDQSIRNLLKVITQIQNQSESGGIDFLKSTKPYWHLCTEKFYAAYLKAKNPDGFKDMFFNFYSKNEDKFLDDVVDEDGDINDEWLKNKDVITVDKHKKKSKKSSDDLSFSLRNINCRGQVIYFDETNEKIRNVCIPISEAYINACKIFSELAKKEEYSPLPAQLLHNLFVVISFVVEDEDDKKSVEDNIKALKEVLEQLGEEDTSDDTGDTLTPLGGLMKNLMKKFNLGKDGAIDMSTIEKSVGNLLNGENDMMSKAKGIFQKFSEKANIKEGADLSTIISGVSDAMKDQSIQNELKGALAEVASSIGFSVPDFNDKEKAEINGATDVAAAEQE